MTGQYFHVTNKFQLDYLIGKLHEFPMPFYAQVKEPQYLKTNPQLAKIHAMIRDVAVAKKTPESSVKTDVKREFGIVEVSTSTITGDRAVRLKSFADYTKDQLAATITAFQVWIDEEGICTP